MVKFGYTIIYVADVEVALAFYESAFELQRGFVTPEKDYGELDTGATILAFASHELGASNVPSGYLRADEEAKPFGIEIALECDDVNAIYQRAIAYGAIKIKTPEYKPWGQTVAYVRCPSGVLLELCSPMSA